jgi:tRNA1(Val) A37 N6-methylase TrmN6
MEQLHNGFTLELCDGAFPLSTDSIALSAFAQLPKNARVLDLGSGCGTLGLLLCAKDSNCCVTGIELDPRAHETALRNAAQNGISHRLTSICADIGGISSLVAAGSFSVCISNPPYFSAGPQSKSVPLARRDDLCSMDTLMTAAARALQYGGDFFLVHRPERLAQLCAVASAHKLEPKRLQLLRHRSDGPVTLVLVQCRKGGKPGLLWEEESLHAPDGTPTAYYRDLYHL